jgi:hypothetical protein
MVVESFSTPLANLLEHLVAAIDQALLQWKSF